MYINELQQLLKKFDDSKDKLYLNHKETNTPFIYINSFINQREIPFVIVESLDGDVFHFNINNLEFKNKDLCNDFKININENSKFDFNER